MVPGLQSRLWDLLPCLHPWCPVSSVSEWFALSTKIGGPASPSMEGPQYWPVGGCAVLPGSGHRTMLRPMEADTDVDLKIGEGSLVRGERLTQGVRSYDASTA